MKDDPAFPRVEAFNLYEQGEQGVAISTASLEARVAYGGLSKREYLAAMAMQGILASCPNSYPERKPTAERAIQFADALLAELEKK